MMMLLHCMQDCICPLPSLLGRRKGKKRSKLLFSSVAHAFFIVAVSFQDQVLRVKGAKFTLRLNLIEIFSLFFFLCCLFTLLMAQFVFLERFCFNNFTNLISCFFFCFFFLHEFG